MKGHQHLLTIAMAADKPTKAPRLLTYALETAPLHRP